MKCKAIKVIITRATKRVVSLKRRVYDEMANSAFIKHKVTGDKFSEAQHWSLLAIHSTCTSYEQTYSIVRNRYAWNFKIILKYNCIDVTRDNWAQKVMRAKICRNILFRIFNNLANVFISLRFGLLFIVSMASTKELRPRTLTTLTTSLVANPQMRVPQHLQCKGKISRLVDWFAPHK